MTYGELESTLGHEVVRTMEDVLGQAFVSAGSCDTSEKYDALLELMAALLAASIITKQFDAATRARHLATRLVALVDHSLTLIEDDRLRHLS